MPEKLLLLVTLVPLSLESMLNSDFLELDLSEVDSSAMDIRFDQKIDELHQWAEIFTESMNKETCV